MLKSDNFSKAESIPYNDDWPQDQRFVTEKTTLFLNFEDFLLKRLLRLAARPGSGSLHRGPDSPV